MKPLGDNPRYERWRWQIFGVTWLVYAAYYLARKSFALAKVAFKDDPNVTLTRADYALVDSAYLSTYMVGQFIWGPLGDRFGPRRVLIAGILLVIVAALATGFSTGLVAFVIFAVVQGIGQSTGWANTAKAMAAWFSIRERGWVMGVWCTHYAVGAAVALPFAGLLMAFFGSPRPAGQQGSAIVPFWPAAYWGAAAVMGLVLLLVWLLLRDRPEDVGLPPIEQYHGETESTFVAGESPQQEPERSWKVIAEVLRVPTIWLLAISYFSIKLTRYALYFWGPLYIYNTLGTDVKATAFTAAALPIGGAIGVALAGYVSDKAFQSRRFPVTVLCLLATVAVMTFGLVRIESAWLMGTFFFFIGFFLFGPDSIISGTAAVDFGTKKGAGTAAGFINGIGSIGAIIGGGPLPAMITSEGDWSALFYVFIGGLLFSALILAPLWRTMPPTAEETQKDNKGHPKDKPA